MNSCRNSDYSIVVIKLSNVNGAKGITLLRKGGAKHLPDNDLEAKWKVS